MKKIILIFLIINSSVVAQNCIANKKSISIIKADIEYLSDDKLEGREVGTKGEELALKYLQKRFKEIGLKTIVHEFEFNTLTNGLDLRGITINRLNKIFIKNPDKLLKDINKCQHKYDQTLTKIINQINNPKFMLNQISYLN